MTPIKTKLTKLLRNKWLSAGAGLLIVGVSIYFTTNVKPRAAELDKAHTRLNELHRQIQQSMMPPETLAKIEQLESELAKRQRELSAAKGSLEGITPFASVNGSAEIQSLNLKLSELAAAANVQIRQRSSYAWPESNSKSNDKLSPAPPNSYKKTTLASTQSASSAATETSDEEKMIRELYGDSLQQFEVEATYAGLREFIDGLDRLPRPVVIVKFEIHIDAGDAKSATDPILKSILILAM